MGRGLYHLARGGFPRRLVPSKKWRELGGILLRRGFQGDTAALGCVKTKTDMQAASCQRLVPPDTETSSA